MLYLSYSLNALFTNESLSVSFTYTVLIYHKTHFIHCIECPNFDEFWQLCCLLQNSPDTPLSESSPQTFSKSYCENDSKTETGGLRNILYIGLSLTLFSNIFPKPHHCLQHNPKLELLVSLF